MHRYMVGLIALDFILRVTLRAAMHMSLIIVIPDMHLNDLTADMPGLRVPGHVIPYLESVCHLGSNAI